MQTMDGQRFGSLIRRMRARHGLTTLELSNRIERSPSYISKVETGGLRETPPPDVLEAFSRELQISVSELLEAMGYNLQSLATVRELPDDLTPAQREAIISYARYLASQDQRSG